MSRTNPVLLVVGVVLAGWLAGGCSSEVGGPNRAPVAVAGGDRTIEIGAEVLLDAGASYDPDPGDAIVSWQWELVVDPAAQATLLHDGDAEVARLTPQQAGVWVVRLVVGDGRLLSDPDVVWIRVRGTAPCTRDEDCQEDDSWCTVVRCLDGVCQFTPRDCDDGDPCTQNVCNEDLDRCEHPPVTRLPAEEGPVDDPSCSDGVDNDCDGRTDGDDTGCIVCSRDGECDDGNPCTQDSCREQRCANQPVSDGTLCDDGLYCTVEETCQNGWCTGGSGRDCASAGDACNQGVCDEQQDACVAVPVDDGTSCDDELWCTLEDACLEGVCQGTARNCSDEAGPCEVGVCDEAADACEAQPVADGTLCDDGEFCNVNERCTGGACGGGEPRDCSGAGGGCVDGVCDEEQDACVGDPLEEGTPCNDSLYCTVDDQCDADGDCVGAQRDCSMLDGPCRTGICDEDARECTAAPTNQGGACDDGLFCTEPDTCSDGNCGGPARICDDGDPCTQDACDEANDRCTATMQPNPGAEGPYDHASCSNALDDDCDGLTDGNDPDCQQCQQDVDCEDDNPCTVNTCSAGQCQTQNVSDGEPCDDGLYCTDPDSCTAGVCGGPPQDCSHLDDQCNQGVCNPASEACEQQPIHQDEACDDGSFCNLNETCQDGVCTGGEGRDCSWLDDACNQGVCDEDAGQCLAEPVNQGQACSDGLYCTVDDACQDGVCTGTERDCAGFGNQCNQGVCDEDGDACQAEPANEGQACDDSQFCTVDETCQAGVCTGGDPKYCGYLDDDCNLGVCDEQVDACEAQPANQGDGCEDGDLCTQGETCQDGLCTGGTAVDCSHLDTACAEGVCDPATGDCGQQPIHEGESCEDGDLCTVGETCQGGTCTGGGPKDCSHLDDQCIQGVCDSATGDCEAQPVGAGDACDDGDLCTIGDVCDDQGTCQGVDKRTLPEAEGGCEDENPCTDDDCDPQDGSCVHLDNNDACDDGFSCTIDDACQDGICTGTPSDDVCVSVGTAGDICAPACSPDASGCVTPPDALELVCESPVDLSVTSVSACTITLPGGDTGQQECLDCSVRVGKTVLAFADFGDDTGACDLDGWELVPGESQGDFCSDNIDNCSPGGSNEDCCDDLAKICREVPAWGYTLFQDKWMDCGSKHEQFRLERTFDFSGMGNLRVCFDVADHGANNNEGVLVYVFDQSENRQQVYCLNGEPLEGADDRFVRVCSDLFPAWAEDNPNTTVQFIVHSETDHEIMFLDNVEVTGWSTGCPPTDLTVFDDDFDDGTGGCDTSSWTFSGSYKNCPGFECGEHPDWSPGVEADGTDHQMTTTVNASALDADVQVCFQLGYDGTSGEDRLTLLYNAGAGFQPAWQATGTMGSDGGCHEECVDLSLLDPAVENNPSLGLRFNFHSVNGKIQIYRVRVAGKNGCVDDPALVTLTAPEPGTIANSYTFDASDVSGEPLDAKIRCQWTPDPGIQDRSEISWRDPFAGWGLRRELVFDNSAQDEDLVNFPVLVKLEAGWFDYQNTHNGGADLRFVDADLTTVLPHEIENWNDEGTSVVWVRVPRIPANSNTDSIWMYYDNPGASAAENPADVWDPYFTAVWHLAEDEGTTAFDSGGFAHDGAYQNGVTQGQPGGFGDLAASFDGSDDRVDLGGLDVVGARGNDGITIEVFARPVDHDSDDRLVSKADGTSDSDHWWMLSTYDDGRRLRFRLKTGGGTSSLVGDSDRVTNEVWFYGVATYDGNQMRLYFDGQPHGSQLKLGTIDVHDGKAAWIGANPDSSKWWDGDIGEVRISRIARSPVWIAAQQLSFSGALVTFKDPENL